MASVEGPNPAGEPLHQNDSSNTISTANPGLAADEHEVEKRGAPGTAMVPEQPSRFYWVRALVLILIPTIITVYYGVIWVLLVQSSVHDEAAQYRTYSGSLIFYSWFIIGVFGLSWAKFGLAGVEASMLRSEFWGAPSLVALLMHSNGTWSSPSGWVNAIVHREFHRLWCLLAFLSFLPFIALPLSGLVFEISDGYISVSEAPFVEGRNIDNFNARYDAIDLDQHRSASDKAAALLAWESAALPFIPKLGIVYTPESIDRSEHSIFESLPNGLPLTEPIPDLFLTAQPDKPVSGTAWGLRFKYDCSIVQSVSQFTILSQKSAASIIERTAFEEDKDLAVRLELPSGDQIGLWTSLNTQDSLGSNRHNTQAYFEIGTSAPLQQQNKSEHYDGRHPEFEADGGNTTLVLELALWQIRVDTMSRNSLEHFDHDIGPTIEGLGSVIVERDNGTYALNDTFLTLEDGVIKSGFLDREFNASGPTLSDVIRGSSFGKLLHVAPPIGVRCVSSSDLGTAELDGVTSTFRSFERNGPTIDPARHFTGSGSAIFGRTAQHILGGHYFQHYTSGNLGGTQPGSTEDGRRYEQYVDPKALLRSVNLAYALDATNLLFDPTSSFKEEWLEKRLTSSRQGKILTVASLIPGSEVGYLVLALFALWAVLSVGLGLWYGFRKRPADRLDGYVMLRKGADMADELKGNSEFMSGKSYHNSETLAALPGDVLGARS